MSDYRMLALSGFTMPIPVRPLKAAIRPPPSSHLELCKLALFLYSSNYFILEMSPKDVYTPIYKTLTLRESQKI